MPRAEQALINAATLLLFGLVWTILPRQGSAGTTPRSASWVPRSGPTFRRLLPRRDLLQPDEVPAEVMFLPLLVTQALQKRCSGMGWDSQAGGEGSSPGAPPTAHRSPVRRPGKARFVQGCKAALCIHPSASSRGWHAEGGSPGRACPAPFVRKGN